MTFQLPNLRPILRPVAALAMLAVIALAPTPVSLSGVALAQTPAPTNSASPTSPPTAVASSSNDATLHKVHIGGDGFSIINPGPGEEASGNIAFDKDNEATVELDSYLTSSSICAWPTQPQASVAIDREDSLAGITFDQSLHYSKGCASPVDFDVQTGSNDVTITVTAPDGVTIIRYLITIVVPERPAAPAPETWAQDPVTRGHTFITPYTNEALATGFTSANGSADSFWIASIRVEEELARVVVSLYNRETGEVDRGAGFNIGPCNGVPSTFRICEYGSFANPELWYGNGILWVTVEKHDSGHGNRHYLYAFQRTASSWKLLSDKTIRLTHYDHISAGRDNSPGGIWSDGETMWVTGHHLRVYAYNMATGERDRSEEFSVPGTTGKLPFLPYSVGSPAGLWSNGKTMWVEGAKRRVVYAFDLQTKARVPSRDFDIVRAPPPPSPYDIYKMITSGMWSDGSIIWVRQGLFNVAFDLPGTPPQFATLYAVEMASDSNDVPNLITVDAADADNDSIRYAKVGDWPAQFGIDSTSGVINYTRGIGASVAPGEYELTVTADDGIDGTAETTVVVSVSGNTGICDRTPQVRYGILALLRNVGDCELVTNSDLAGITGDLLLSDAGITALQDGDFSGLTRLQGLNLGHNDLTSLPDGLFEGLSDLDWLRLEGNPGAPFTLTAELEEQGDGALVVKVAEGSPFDLTVTLSARGGTLSSTAVVVEAGSLASGPVDVKTAGGGPGRVTVSAVSATFPEDREYASIDTGLGQPLVLDVPGSQRGQRGDGGTVPGETVWVTAPASVPQDAEAAVTMTFGGLGFDSDTSDTDYVFRADVVGADGCEGGGMGFDRYMYKVDEDPEVREGSISASCAPGDYTVEVSISSPDNVELASATAGFTVNAPDQQQPEPLSTDATLSGLTLSDVSLAFASDTTSYTASVANDVTQTTVSPTTNDGGAAYEIKLDGVADADGVIPLAVGTNAIAIEVTAEDGNAVKTYKVTVTRAVLPSSGPAVAIALSPSGPVDEGVEVTVTMSFANLESDSDTSTTDYVFRADVRNADGCEGGGMGNDRYMYKVDEDPEVREGSISASCTPGDYTVEVSISSPDNVELASATAGFTVNAPDQQQSEPASTDATLSGLTLSDVTLAFASNTTRYTANVASDMDETTVTAAANDGGATYVVKLEGVADSDGVIPLAEGGNVITVEVTAEDGNTVRTYTVTVTRAAPPSADATLSDLALSGVDIGTFDPATTEYAASVGNEVEQTTVTATANDGGAAYAVKLDGVADADGTVPLDVGGNVITVEVTAEDGNTAKTYTVTVTRTALPPAVAPDSPDAPTGSLDGAGDASLDWNDVETATGYEVGLWWNGEWTTLPNDGAGPGVSISGSGATVTGLPTYWTVYYFRVRAVNEAGTSDWSPMSKLEF